MPLTEHDKTLLIETLCCVVAADGRVSGREVAVVAEALTQAGCPTTAEEIRSLVIEMSKQIHVRDVRRYADRVAAQLLVVRNATVIGVMQKSLDALIAADGKTSEQETEIVKHFRDAIRSTASSILSTHRNTSLGLVPDAVKPRRWYAPLIAAGLVWVLALALLLAAHLRTGYEVTVGHLKYNEELQKYFGAVEQANALEARYRSTAKPADLSEWQNATNQAAWQAKGLHETLSLGFPTSYPDWIGCIIGVLAITIVLLLLCYRMPQSKGNATPEPIAFGVAGLSLFLLLWFVVSIFANSSARYGIDHGIGSTPEESGRVLSFAGKHVAAVVAAHVLRGADLDSLPDATAEFWQRHKEIVARGNAQIEAIVRCVEDDSTLSEDVKRARTLEIINIEASSTLRGLCNAGSHEVVPPMENKQSLRREQLDADERQELQAWISGRDKQFQQWASSLAKQREAMDKASYDLEAKAYDMSLAEQSARGKARIGLFRPWVPTYAKWYQHYLEGFRNVCGAMSKEELRRFAQQQELEWGGY